MAFIETFWVTGKVKRKSFLQALVFASFISIVELKCPSPCTCSSIIINCFETQIEIVPDFSSYHGNPLIIDLSGNKISMIGSEDFKFSKNYMVKEIYLNDSFLIDIDEKAFAELEGLQELYLGNNMLTSIPMNVIENLMEMILMDLSGNYFSGNMPVIKSESLEVLTIVNCQITSISSQSIEHLPNLKLLSMEQNNIHTLNTDILKPISNQRFLLKLPHNTWHCKCETVQVLNYLSRYKYIDNTDKYECHINNESVKIFEGNLETKLCELKKSVNKSRSEHHLSIQMKSNERNHTRNNFESQHEDDVEIITVYNNNYYIALGFSFLMFVSVALILYYIVIVEFKHINGSESTTQLL